MNPCSNISQYDPLELTEQRTISSSSPPEPSPPGRHETHWAPPPSQEASEAELVEGNGDDLRLNVYLDTFFYIRIYIIMHGIYIS